jgi:hypothetical protein
MSLRPARVLTPALAASLAALLAAAGPAAGADAPTTTTTGGATTTTTTSTPGTTPPAVPPPAPYVPDLGPAPPPFRYDEDSGRELVRDLAAARDAIALNDAQVVVLAGEIPALERQRRVAALRLRLARSAEREIDRDLARTGRRVRNASARAYLDAQRSDIVPAVQSLLSADSVMDAGRAVVLVDAYNTAQFERRDELETGASSAAAARAARDDALERVDADLLAARGKLAGARLRAAAARLELAGLLAYQEEWLDAASRTAASSIMGPSALDVDDLVRKVRAADVTVRLTVPLEELAAMFLEEGAAEGVRGDVAFAQSILETGSFSNPVSGSIVNYTDNNFAGMGACDSCEHGIIFKTARDGVRAQIQALRLHADPTIDGPEDFAHPPVLPSRLKVTRAGGAKIWYELTGKWATGAGYGLHVFDVYRQMHRTRTIAPPPAEPATTAVAVGPPPEAIAIAFAAVTPLRGW